MEIIRQNNRIYKIQLMFGSSKKLDINFWEVNGQIYFHFTDMRKRKTVSMTKDEFEDVYRQYESIMQGVSLLQAEHQQVERPVTPPGNLLQNILENVMRYEEVPPPAQQHQQQLQAVHQRPRYQDDGQVAGPSKKKKKD